MTSIVTCLCEQLALMAIEEDSKMLQFLETFSPREAAQDRREQGIRVFAPAVGTQKLQ
jgi:hypothetical protein